jgi:hypothetical protein
VKLNGDIPLEAAGVLLQRMTQMLEGGAFEVSEEAKDTVWVTASVVEHMTTPGSISQSVLVLDIKTVYGEAEEVFNVKGVGKDDADAWLRACKQVLPRSKQAQEFIDKLKNGSEAN